MPNAQGLCCGEELELREGSKLTLPRRETCRDHTGQSRGIAAPRKMLSLLTRVLYKQPGRRDPDQGQTRDTYRGLRRKAEGRDLTHFIGKGTGPEKFTEWPNDSQPSAPGLG